MARRKKFDIGGLVADAIGPSKIIGDENGNFQGTNIAVDPLGDLQKKWLGIKGESMIAGDDKPANDPTKDVQKPKTASTVSGSSDSPTTPAVVPALQANGVVPAQKPMKRGGIVGKAAKASKAPKAAKARGCGKAERGLTKGRMV